MNCIQFALRILFVSMYSDHLVYGLLLSDRPWADLWGNMTSNRAPINFRSSCPWTYIIKNDKAVPQLHRVASRHCLDLVLSNHANPVPDAKGVCEKIYGRPGSSCSGNILGYTCVRQRENIVTDKRNSEFGGHGDGLGGNLDHHAFMHDHHDSRSSSVIGQHEGTFREGASDMGGAVSNTLTETPESENEPLISEKDTTTAPPVLMELLTRKEGSHNKDSSREVSGQRELQQNVVPPFLGGSNTQIKPSFLQGNIGQLRLPSGVGTSRPHLGSAGEFRLPSGLGTLRPQMPSVVGTLRPQLGSVGQFRLPSGVGTPHSQPVSVGQFRLPSSVGTPRSQPVSVGQFRLPSGVGMPHSQPMSVGQFRLPSGVGMPRPQMGLLSLWQGQGSSDNARRFRRALHRQRSD